MNKWFFLASSLGESKTCQIINLKYFLFFHRLFNDFSEATLMKSSNQPWRYINKTKHKSVVTMHLFIYL